MTFVFAGALASILLVLAPLAAHLLRVRRAKQQLFAPAALVPAAPPMARKRSRIEDGALFAIRALAIIALAFLGATPLVRCARLALGRNAGANVALVIVVDDSMSMRAQSDSGPSRFDAARKGAFDLLASCQEGDSVAIVTAGAPARVLLASTTDISAASKALDALQPSDRATDIDSALGLARAMLRNLPQSDRRVVLLSDLCDGHPKAPPIGEGLDVALWAPRQGLDGPGHDCALLRADRRESTVLVRLACSDTQASKGRTLEVRAQSKVLGQRAVELSASEGPQSVDLSIDLNPDGTPEPDQVVLTGPADSIPSDDQTPIAKSRENLLVAVISDPAAAGLATGGPPPVEQALGALETGLPIRPLPVVPDTLEELSPYGVLVLDDPPGLTPEARQSITQWLERGGTALIALGPQAAASPLGSTLDPFVRGVPRWESPPPKGIDPATGGWLGPSAEGLELLNAQGRAVFELEATEGTEVLVRWADGAPLVFRKSFGRGTAFVLSLPMSAERSDLVVRPAFLSLLLSVLDVARAHGSSQRIEVGSSWSFEPGLSVEVRSAQGPVPLEQSQGARKVTPALAGRYDFRIDGTLETRFAMIPEREVDLRPRAFAPAATRPELGATTSSIDISRHIAGVLLALLVAELAVRVVLAAREKAQPNS